MKYGELIEKLNRLNNNLVTQAKIDRFIKKIHESESGALE